MGLKKLNVRDAKAAMPGCTVVTNIEEVNKRPPFVPGTQRLLKGDKIRVNITDEDGNLLWGKDPTLRNALFVLATLIRGERVLEHYHLFPTMLLRTSLKKLSAKHSEDAKNPDYAHNEGIIEMLPSQRLSDYMQSYVGYELLVADIDSIEVWTLDFSTIERDKIKLEDEKRPLRDDLWIATNSKFYTFEMSELTEPEESDPTEEADATEQNG